MTYRCRVSADLVERVYEVLEREADFDGVVIHGDPETAAECGVTTQSAYSAVHELIESGRLELVASRHDSRWGPRVLRIPAA